MAGTIQRSLWGQRPRADSGSSGCDALDTYGVGLRAPRAQSGGGHVAARSSGSREGVGPRAGSGYLSSQAPARGGTGTGTGGPGRGPASPRLPRRRRRCRCPTSPSRCPTRARVAARGGRVAARRPAGWCGRARGVIVLVVAAAADEGCRGEARPAEQAASQQRAAAERSRPPPGHGFVVVGLYVVPACLCAIARVVDRQAHRVPVRGVGLAVQGFRALTRSGRPHGRPLAWSPRGVGYLSSQADAIWSPQS